MRALRSPILYALVLGLCLAAESPARESLEWKLDPGETLGYELTLDQQISHRAREIERSERCYTFRIRLTGDEVRKDGRLEATATIVGLAVEVTDREGQQASYDSDEPGPGKSHPYIKPYVGMVGEKLQLHLEPDGRIHRADGMEELLGAVLTDMLFESAVDLIKRLMSRKLKATLTDAGSRFLPDEPVSEGDTWSVEQSYRIPTIGELKLDYDYRHDGYVDVDGTRCVRIAIARSSIKAGTFGLGRLLHPVTGRAVRSKGTFLFDPAAGRLIEQDSTMRLTIDQRVEIDGDKQRLREVVRQRTTLKFNP